LHFTWTLFSIRENMTMSLVRNRNMMHRLTMMSMAKKKIRSITTKNPNWTQNHCPNDYVSSTIKIQHVSENIGYSIVTNAAFKQNDIVYETMISFAELQECPDKYSIQVAKEWHWNTTNDPNRYIQHSCFNLNCKVVLEVFRNLENSAIREAIGSSKHEDLQDGEGGDFARYKLVALRQIGPGTPVTVNYNSFEWELSTPFFDSEAPSEYVNSINKEAAKNEALHGSRLKNGARPPAEKGRLVGGYQFIKPDEKKFLIDHGLVLQHIQEKEYEILNGCEPICA